MFNRIVKTFAALALSAVMFVAVPLSAQAAVPGIDVSKYQGAINWSAVAQSGMAFTFIKAGSTNKGVDPFYAQNVAGAQAAGIRTGVYIYSYATSVPAAQNEAQLMLKWMEGRNINYPVAFDIEDACQKGLDPNTCTAMCNAFGDIISAAGYTPVIYTYTNFYKRHMTSALKYPVWIAQYGAKCEIPNATVWQYSSSGSVAGIGGRVDMNVDNVDWRNYIVAAGPCNIAGHIYIFNNFRKTFGWTNIAGKYFLTNPTTGIAVTDTWYTEPTNNKIYYLNNTGMAVTGLNTINNAIYFFNNDATLYKGWLDAQGATLLFSPQDGKLVTGWYKDQTGTYYLDPTDGHRYAGAQTIGKDIYYFAADGKMQTGLVTIDKNKFFFGPDGKMQKGFINVAGKLYYFGDNGAMVTGIFQDSTGTFYAASTKDSHIVVNEPVTVGNTTFVFGADGKLVKDQIYTIGNMAYACGPDGVVTATAPVQAAKAPAKR